MQSLFESLIKKSIFLNEMQSAGAPSIILNTEEKFIDEKVQQFFIHLSTIAEELKATEIEELTKCSPCYICKNSYREKGDNFQPLKCLEDNSMNDEAIKLRISTGCKNWNEDKSKYPSVTEEKIAAIQTKYANENLKKAIKLICDKLLSK